VICGARNSCFFDKVIFAMLVTTLTGGQFSKRASFGGLNESGVCDFVLCLECGGGILALRNLDDASKDYSAEVAAIVVDELTRNILSLCDRLRFWLRRTGIDRIKFGAETDPGFHAHD
jgi:hypothetical protein